MKRPTNSAPDLRFPEFSDQWIETALGETKLKIIDGDRGLNYPKTDDLLGAGFCLFLNAKNVTRDGFVFIDPTFITKEKDEKLKKGKLKRDDIVLTTRGTVGNVAYYDETVPFEHIRINSGMVLIRNESKNIDSRFLYTYFFSPSLKKQISTIAFGSAQPALTVGEINKLKISLTSLREQQKIAAFLSALDEKIGQLAQKKELLLKYKKGVIQEVFDQKTRFKDDNGNDFPDWGTISLGEVLDYEQPTKYLVSDTEYSDAYSTPVLTAGKTFILGYTNETHGVYEKDLPVIIFDDFTTAFKFVNFRFKAKSSAMKILKPRAGMNLRFIFEAMQRLKFVVGNHERHWISKFSYLTIDLPVPAEQQKIATFLSVLDEKFDLVNQQLERVKEFQKGLLQRMLV